MYTSLPLVAIAAMETILRTKALTSTCFLFCFILSPDQSARRIPERYGITVLRPVIAACYTSTLMMMMMMCTDKKKTRSGVSFPFGAQMYFPFSFHCCSRFFSITIISAYRSPPACAPLAHVSACRDVAATRRIIHRLRCYDFVSRYLFFAALLLVIAPMPPPPSAYHPTLWHYIKWNVAWKRY